MSRAAMTDETGATARSNDVATPTSHRSEARRTRVNGVPGVEVVWQPGRGVPIVGILGLLRRGAGDPTMVVARGQVWWAPLTPEGPAATWWRVEPRDPDPESSRPSSGDRVVMRAFGPGASWVAARVPRILGDDDDVTGFAPQHRPIENALRQSRYQQWRVPRTELVVTSLVPSILEQKVTGKQAFGGFRSLVQRYGAPAPFPDDVVRSAGEMARQVGRLQVAPSAAQWRRIPSWAWLQAGVEPPQSRTVMRALAHAERLEESASLPLPEAHRRLRSIPGLGVWTVAKIAQTAWGDADSPTYADYHIAKQIGHALIGQDVDDAGMARLLEPYRGHRYRAEHLILAGGFQRERHGARMSLPTHLPTRRGARG